MNLSRRGAVAGLLATAVMPYGVPAQDQLRALTRAYNASGQDLSKSFSAAPGNIVFSPYSIGTAMAMVLAGARGETEQQMAGVLRHALARDAVADANAKVLAILNGYDKSKASPICPEGMQLAGPRCEMQRSSDARCPPRTPLEDALCFATPERLPSAKVAVANALVLTRKDAPVSSAFVALVKDKFAAELFQDAGLAEINDFVATRTEGRIERILDQLDELVRGGFAQRRLFQGGVGVGLQQGEHARGAVQPDRLATCQRTDDAQARDRAAGGAHRLSRGPAALCGRRDRDDRRASGCG